MNETDRGSPPPRWLMRLFTAINVLVYRLSGGRWMKRFEGCDICVVTMRGAKSGRTRRIPLMYVPHAEGVLLVASQGGAPSHPVWYYNLLAHPEIEVTVHGTRRKLRARLASSAEKETLWPVCVEYYPAYEEYQQRTQRDIPVFVCS